MPTSVLPDRRSTVAATLAASLGLAIAACSPGEPPPTVERGLAGPILASAVFWPAERIPIVSARESLDWDAPSVASTVSLDEGWGPSEAWGRWTVGDRSTLRVQLPEGPPPDTLGFVARSTEGVPAGQRQTAEIWLNGAHAGTTTIGRTWQRGAVTIPEGFVPGENTIELRFSHAIAPLQSAGDDRPLSVAFESLSLRRATSEERAQADEAATPEAPFDVTPDRTIVLRESGRLLLPLYIPAGTSSAILGLTPDRTAWFADAVELSATLRWMVTPDRAHALTVAELDGWSDRTELAVSLPPSAGQFATLALDIDLGDPGTWLELDAVALAGGASPARRTAPTAEAAAPEPPDVVVILLDAARPDHMGAYGYHRDTTPAIDRLADEALVFRQIFAQTPYTLASVPTIITGLSFVEHGVLERGQALDDSAVTLAEAFQANGYGTACFSASPNNSVAVNASQGCDEFHELWVGVDRETWLDPFRMSRLAIERLGRDEAGKPLFMLLHYVPPHDPYAPAPRFDVFTDPEYAGAADGTIQTIERINEGELSPSPADLEHIVALYDGNLLMADAAVAELLDALGGGGRWDDTIVLVVSDHGEAFFEHGRMGHNATLYDEMTHVPFILKLPARFEPGAVDTDQLGTLEDLLPTLLDAAGIPLPGEVDGRSLLGNRGVTDSVLMQSAGVDAGNALRTLAWKMIAGPDAGAGALNAELYALDRDPDEQTNLIASELDVFQALDPVRRLRQRLRFGDLATTDSRALSEDDMRALRSLGYIR